MRTRNLVLSLVLALSGLALAFCGGTEKKAGPDAGHASPDRFVAECAWSFDCAEGDCVDYKCVKCTATSCGAGQACSADLKCTDCDGGACAVVSDGGVATCTKREDCPVGLACRNSKCQDPDPTGRCLVNDECAVGQVCNFSNNTCIVGCFSNTDCKGVVLDGGLPAPHCDTAVSNQCGPCVDSNDCALGERCNVDRCEKAPECVPPDRTPCGDRACMPIDGGYTCAPCVRGEDCAATGYDCVGGKCKEQATGCTDDSQCKTISPGHICDKGTGQCEWGCLPASDGSTCAPNCCPTDQTCNPATHQCEGGSTCTDCNPPCMGIGQVCDTSTCQCRSETAGDGGTTAGECDGDKCTGCGPGQKCKCFGAFECIPGVGCGPLAAICTAD